MVFMRNIAAWNPCVEEESGSRIVDVWTAPRNQLMTMLKTTQDNVRTVPQQQQRQQHGEQQQQQLQHQQQGHQQQTLSSHQAGAKQGRATKAGSKETSVSLSELSVSDPGMREPEVWWSQVQQVGIQVLTIMLS